MTQFRTISQVAEYLGVHPKTVRAWIDSGKLKAIRVGRLYRVPEEALEDFTSGPLQHEAGLRHEGNGHFVTERRGNLARQAERLSTLADDLRREADDLRDELLEEARAV